MTTQLPRSVEEAILAIQRLPGIGPKSAVRLVFYLLNTPQEVVNKLSTSLIDLKQRTKFCQKCFSVTEDEMCLICKSEERDQNLICVVEKSIDVLNFERLGTFKGVYHVLGGVINPLERVGPDDLTIDQLVARVTGFDKTEKIEVIVATSMTMEGEATALYLKDCLEKLEYGDRLTLTRIGMGLPVGSDLSYVDEATLSRALEGKRKL